MERNNKKLNSDSNPNAQPDILAIEGEDKGSDEGFQTKAPMDETNNAEEEIDWAEDGEEEDTARLELSLVGKLWNDRNVNTNAFITTIVNVWQAKHGVEISNIGKNMYVFQFHHWRDKQKVLENQPWHFDRFALLLGDISDKVKPSETELHHLPMWVRVYNLPLKGRFNAKNVEAVAPPSSKMGTTGTNPGVARKLFVTKPKQNDLVDFKTQINDVLDQMKGCVIREGVSHKATALTEEQQTNNKGAQDPPSPWVQCNEEDEVGQESFDAPKEFSIGADNPTKAKKKKWTRITREDTSKIHKTGNISGNKRESREVNEHGQEYMEVDYPRTNKKVEMAAPMVDNTGLLLEGLHGDQNIPWLCGGDFNLMLMSSEKRGGGVFKMHEAEIFRRVVSRCELNDLGYIGHNFTWSNNREDDQNIQERLDRFLANDLWKEYFPGSFVTHLTKRRSDHLPILLLMQGCPKGRKEQRKKKLFRFEEMWLREESSEEVVKKAWEGVGDLRTKLTRTVTGLQSWSKDTFEML
ncbi:Aspartate--tRNA ligase 1 cytoplasmic [Bienertia sinuspersici]